jgi:SAM-dependent methyltransferase
MTPSIRPNSQQQEDDLTGAESQAETGERLLHGSSFGAAAAAYAEHRPGYADAAVGWALEPVRTRQPLRVLDLGAGTGKLTAALARLGLDVTAVEPDPAMLAELRRQLPSARALPGSAEDIPMPEGGADAVLVGQVRRRVRAADGHRRAARSAQVARGSGGLDLARTLSVGREDDPAMFVSGRAGLGRFHGTGTGSPASQAAPRSYRRSTSGPRSPGMSGFTANPAWDCRYARYL